MSKEPKEDKPEMVWVDTPAGNRRKDKKDLKELIDAGLIVHDEDTVETYRMTDAGRRAYITGELTDDKDERL